MKSSSNFDNNLFDSNNKFDFKKHFFKYLYYWKFFSISTIIFLVFAYTYLRYTSKIYKSAAKIQILDKKDTSVELPTAKDLFSKSKINIENEIEVIKSYPILDQVIKNKNLHTSIISVGDVMKSLTVDYPFEISLKLPVDSMVTSNYELNITDQGFEIINLQENNKRYSFKGTSSKKFKHNLPFEVHDFNRKKFLAYDMQGYEIQFTSVSEKVSQLKNSIEISQLGKQSDIISLSINSANSKRSATILNEIINVFNNDGVQDRQLIHKRTIDFVNERYSSLSTELDSIESVKQLFKIDNDLIDLAVNSTISLEKSFESEESVFNVENQISITKLLINTLANDTLELLPTNMLTESSEINKLITEYNQKILDRKKLVSSAGSNNPSTKQIENTLYDFRSNIIFSLQNHLNQLKNYKNKLSNKSFKYSAEISNLPGKEKMLRNIERNQKVKEALYLYLLQKREEAEVNYAVTEPSIKVVEYAISDNTPISPNTGIIYLSALLIGILLPYFILYILFITNKKIYSKQQLIDLNLPLPILGEIPDLKDQPNTTILSSSERSPLAESFRVLVSNLKFFKTTEKNSPDVTIVTSTVKGEGKTFTAVNLAYTKASLGKKVLLIGADLHNPQIHNYLDVNKDVNGLVNYLIDDNFNWKKAVLKSQTNINCDILIGGRIPPNPAQLLNNGNLRKLLNEAKEIYDHVIIDTPPCLLVSDTLSISELANLMLFVVRCGLTDIDVLEFIKDSHKKGTIKNNSMLVLNGLGANNSYGYGYAYNYSYGYKYNYSYSYNYGYGYGYGPDKDSD